MSKYDEFFEEPQEFNNETTVFHYEWTEEQIISYVTDNLGEFDKTRLKSGLVRFGFPPEFVVDYQELGACWYTGAREGKGSRKVWIYS